MAKEPDSRPITVEELISGTVPDGGHFPHADSVAVTREMDEGGDTVPPGASGMPGYTTAAPAVRPRARVIGASGMPAYTPAPSTEIGESRNVVTGIIPVVTDDAPEVDTGSLRAVDPDDLIGVELPATGAGLPSATVVVHDANLPAATVVIASEVIASQELGSAAAVADGDAFTDFDQTTTAALFETEAEAVEGSDHLANTGELVAANDSVLLLDEVEAAESAAEAEAPQDRSPLWGWLALAGEVILGVAIGAGLFWGFTILWKQYVYLALVLAVLVIFAIVTFAYVLRKRDLPTTLLALAVGLIVTIGPLVLLV
ncbi:MAG: hypothetical protein WAW85_16330 [Gordonia sp. (in: high G+C Gram-positive bacteria)]|uniref:hypothetical protein n=1 Tax=Gordonia sp. (in: high G+C Gram-positive bacteria) TaxID=84139 RepID=UPI003BB789AA